MNPYLNRYHDLLHAASEELGIDPAAGEPPSHWAYRVLYSMICRMAYASVFDEQDESSDEQQETVSVRHFKDRISSIRLEYLSIYPEISALLSDDGQSLADSIYELYRRSGYFYHAPRRICVSSPCVATEGKTRFERGMPLCRPQRMSGAGMYTLADADSPYGLALSRAPGEMFGLPQTSLNNQWNQILQLANWQQMPEAMQLEYLPEVPPYFNKYWLKTPVANIVSLCRSVQAGQGATEPVLYYLYDTQREPAQIGYLPDWLTHDPHFHAQNPDIHTPYQLVNACLAAQGRLPPVYYQVHGNTTELALQYIFPPAEEMLVELYSWPEPDQHGRFHRWMTTGVFESVRSVLESSGYGFVEKERI